MTTIVTRAGKGSRLTTVEIDANFTNLNTDKLETSTLGTTVQPFLESGTNIKTINGDSVLGAGDLVVSATLADGDKGDITVSSSGTVWTIDNSVVTTAKLGGDITAAGKALLDDADATAQRATLGLVIGTNVQAYDAQLADVAGLTPTDNGVIIGNGTNFVIESGATLKTSLGLTIGTDVQAYDAGLQSIAGLTTVADRTIYTTASDTYAVTTLTSFGRSLIDDADSTAARSTLGLVIGTNVQAYDANTAKLNVAQSWTAEQTFKELKDTVFTITDAAGFQIDPANGAIQTITLGANRTPAATNFEAGQIVLLGIDDGTAFTITWTTVAVTWVKAGGSATPPTLATTGFTWVLLWKVGSVIYGTLVGSP